MILRCRLCVQRHVQCPLLQHVASQDGGQYKLGTGQAQLPVRLLTCTGLLQHN